MAYPGKIDESLSIMYIHEKKHDPGLQIPLNFLGK